MQIIKTAAKKVIDTRHKIARKLSKPIVMLETSAHSVYCFAAFSDGHGLYAMAAMGMLICIILATVIGEEH